MTTIFRRDGYLVRDCPLVSKKTSRARVICGRREMPSGIHAVTAMQVPWYDPVSMVGITKRTLESLDRFAREDMMQRGPFDDLRFDKYSCPKCGLSVRIIIEQDEDDRIRESMRASYRPIVVGNTPAPSAPSDNGG